MPRLPKPKPLRQNSEHRDVGLVALDGGLPPMPDPSPSWLAATKADWAAFWTSPLASKTLPATDTPALRRLHDLRDERERMMRLVRRKRMVIGSQGQPRANPLIAQINAFDAAILALEKETGGSMLSRLKLGISLGDAIRSLADLNSELDTDADDAAEADLLLAYAEPAAEVTGPAGRVLDGGQPRPRSRRRTG